MTDAKKYTVSSGFTLIELTIYGGLLSILLYILSDMFLSVFSMQLTTGADMALKQDGAFVLSRLTYDVRRAESISVPLSGQTAIGMTLVIDAGGTDETHVYSVTDGNLVATVDGVPYAINGQDTQITDFSVERVGNQPEIPDGRDTVHIEFTIAPRADIPQAPDAVEFSTAIGLR